MLYFTVYKTTNLLNGKIYIGAHTTDNPNDNYLGLGKVLLKAIKKNGRNNFKKKILHIFQSKKEMYLQESRIVTKEFVKRKDTYNLKKGGRGGKEKGLKEWNAGITVPNKLRGISYEKLYGKEKAKQLKQNLSAKNIGKIPTNTKRIMCFETNQIFNSIKQASKEFNISINQISATANGKQKSCHGYKWFFIDKNNKPIKPVYKISKCFKQVKCIETKEVFLSIKHAKKKYKGDIGKAANNGTTSAGYHWKFI